MVMMRDATKPGLWTMDWTVDWTLDHVKCRMRMRRSVPRGYYYGYTVCISWLYIPSNNVDRRAPAPYSAMEVILISDNSDSDSNLSIYDTSDLPKVFTPTKKPPVVASAVQSRSLNFSLHTALYVVQHVAVHSLQSTRFYVRFQNPVHHHFIQNCHKLKSW